MSVEEKLNYYIENFTMKTALARYGQLDILAEEIMRHIKKQLSNKNKKSTLQFTSQQLRALVLKIDKVLKQSNKILLFVKQREILEKRILSAKKLMQKETDKNKIDKIRSNIFVDYTLHIAKYIQLSKELQRLYSLFNYYALEVEIIETMQSDYEKEQKKKDDEYLRQELEFILFDLMKNEEY